VTRAIIDEKLLRLAPMYPRLRTNENYPGYKRHKQPGFAIHQTSDKRTSLTNKN